MRLRPRSLNTGMLYHKFLLLLLLLTLTRGQISGQLFCAVRVANVRIRRGETVTMRPLLESDETWRCAELYCRRIVYPPLAIPPSLPGYWVSFTLDGVRDSRLAAVE